MIENIQFIKIKNGWVLTIIDRGISKEHVDDIFFSNVGEIINWIKENVK